MRMNSSIKIFLKIKSDKFLFKFEKCLKIKVNPILVEIVGTVKFPNQWSEVYRENQVKTKIIKCKIMKIKLYFVKYRSDMARNTTLSVAHKKQVMIELKRGHEQQSLMNTT